MQPSHFPMQKQETILALMAPTVEKELIETSWSILLSRVAPSPHSQCVSKQLLTGDCVAYQPRYSSAQGELVGPTKHICNIILVFLRSCVAMGT